MQQVLEHQASTRLQYGLVRRAVTWGWSAARVLVIDEDLGQSSASAEGRHGVQRLVAEVGLDHVGLVVGVEMSRLARSSKDWQQLLAICALFGTLIADLDGIYAPSHDNDRLWLGRKGTMSAAEVQLIQQRMYQGKLQKARRGALGFPLPIGYVGDSAGAMALDPDEQVQQVTRLIFRKFDELGTLHALLRDLVQQDIELGGRRREGPVKGTLEWRRPNRMTLQNLLKHPL
jgi:DNA invertase Pin-like site-specific DNA recombinase